jgi:hypothetical protein
MLTLFAFILFDKLFLTRNRRIFKEYISDPRKIANEVNRSYS